MKLPIAIVMFLWISACSLPQTTVQTGSVHPSLMVQGAPTDAVLYVDGIRAGFANQFNGNPTVLSVLEGVHEVEVRQSDTILYHTKIMVSDGETHVINLVTSTRQ